MKSNLESYNDLSQFIIFTVLIYKLEEFKKSKDFNINSYLFKEKEDKDLILFFSILELYRDLYLKNLNSISDFIIFFQKETKEDKDYILSKYNWENLYSKIKKEIHKDSSLLSIFNWSLLWWKILKNLTWESLRKLIRYLNTRVEDTEFDFFIDYLKEIYKSWNFIVSPSVES